WVIRAEFNSMQIVGREMRRDLALLILDDAPAPASANQVPGTRSQFIEYREGSRPVAKCHRYLKPDGTIGGSGRPDPKWLLTEGEVWIPRHFDFDRCP